MTRSAFILRPVLTGLSFLALAACQQPVEEAEKDPVSFLPEGQPTDQQAALASGNFGSCAVCHGVNLQGNKGVYAPNLTRLPAWYLKAQLASFKAGWRGTAEGDTTGNAMMASALLLDAAGIEAVTAHVVSVAGEKAPAAPLAGGDGTGAALYAENCGSCHGEQGEGLEDLYAPPLAGISDWYLKAQLEKFRAGMRGYHADDVNGQAMQAFAAELSDEDIAALTSYITGGD